MIIRLSVIISPGSEQGPRIQQEVSKDLEGRKRFADSWNRRKRLIQEQLSIQTDVSYNHFDSCMQIVVRF